ncbi:MAG TPA: DNA (cytosine-5-)-methyltransferase [Pyrinomonadaceae bacterium]|nr:DNA (cytosine-5-)-methyltransferase [Pyrinomonadaceae bacterium]
MESEAPQSASVEPNNRIAIISLYAGAGGLDLGFRLEGFDAVIAIDNNQAAVDSYNLNDPNHVAQVGDLSKLKDEEIIALIRKACGERIPRGVIGGPPCQGVSSSNVHKKGHDKRKKALLRYARIVKALTDVFKLDFFVFENVVGLKSKKHRRYFRKIVKALEEAGFSLFEQELDAKDFDVAQKRRRVFIVGINRNLFSGIRFAFPAALGTKKTVRNVIGNLSAPVFFQRSFRPEDIPHHRNHWAMNPRSPKFTNPGNGTGRSFRKLDWDEPSATVAYGHREMHIHPTGTRRVSVYEGMLLQGFPPGYQLAGNFSEQVDQVSNAVPPPLARAIAVAIKTVLYERIANIQKELLAWFEQNERQFPWRQTSDPYKILIAEKLLQQTAVSEKVVSAYQMIVERHPTVRALARASGQDLEPFIQPLGFNYRARELPVLAKTLVKQERGRIPRDLKSLLSLPGIGDYSARAILSFAHNSDVPIVDTNIARLLYRLFGLQEALPSNPARSTKLNTLAARLLPLGKSRKFNLAALDLCASICKARQPQCTKCPIQAACCYGQKASRSNSSASSGATAR